MSQLTKLISEKKTKMKISQNSNNAICNLKKNKKDKDLAPSKFHPCVRCILTKPVF